MDCKFQCSETKAYNAFKNINDLRKTIKILDVTLANTNEVNLDAEHADIVDDWVSQMYDIIKSRATLQLHQTENSPLKAASLGSTVIAMVAEKPMQRKRRADEEEEDIFPR